MLEPALLEVAGGAGAAGLLALLELGRRTYRLTERNNRLLVGEEGLEDDRGLVGRVDRVEARSQRNERAHRHRGNLPLSDGGSSSRQRGESGAD